ncbi:ATPase family AAA domain-containing protein 5 isoform X1 [Neodiprion virginianus]|uniref:ATPase family AAA domain-containing protein 5 isoform X1 n=1 Tax=Neodiprion virginianus TaxID=2961670 RepID=UPI001EE6BFF8|nr:ATPase family AAA domain-containing protein 5 isoform X1 [Neodiprion virginianus]
MKNLTHYFVSPPKTGQEVTASPGDNQNSATPSNADGDKKYAASVDCTREEAELGSGKKTPVKRRLRVKLKISVNDSRTTRCDIINSKDDTVEKTPSPFAVHSSNTRSPVSGNEDSTPFIDSCAKDKVTPNAFKVLMMGKKPLRLNMLPTSSPRDGENNINRSKEHKKKLMDNQRKLIVTADEKGYSKRKNTEADEIEVIENRPKKRAKLFDRKEVENREKNSDKRAKRKGEARKNTAQGFLNSMRSSNSDKGVEIEEDQAKEGTSTVAKDLVVRQPPNLSLSMSSSSSFSTDNTLKTKTKWTMRVQLHSQSDNEEVRDGSSSNDDYIFTPKTKVKFRKTKIRSNNREGKTEERRKSMECKKQDKPNDSRNATNSISKFDSELSQTQEMKHQSRRKNKVKKGNRNIDEDIKQSTDKNPLIDTIESSKTNVIKNPGEQSIIVVNEIMAESNDCSAMMVKKKLAPLFVKKSKPNSATVEARRNFLLSGIPENLKKIISEPRTCYNDIGSSTMPFPMVSHVSQLPAESDSEEISCQTLHKRKQELPLLSFSVNSSHFKSLFDCKEALPKVMEKSELNEIDRVEKINFESVLTDIESRCSETRTMWASISSSLNHKAKRSPRKRTKKLSLQRNSNNPQEEENSENQNPTWTCKYKPISSGEVVGNDEAVTKLRNWLSGWRLPSLTNDHSSGDEFYSSDCDSHNSCENSQVAVLLGPHGSGKTASVYAIAAELGYRVLEVNASSRRTGKKITTDFQEATKSHRVKRVQGSLSVPMKKQPIDKKVPQKSLILIEDVDLIFEEDEGFISATFQLAANTKRPIVMTCKETCPHLNKMAPHQQFIHFQAAKGDRVSALLELISLAESGYRLPQPCLNILLRNGDLRQSLLQLQYILLSGPPSTSQLHSNTMATLWPDMQPLLYKPAIKLSKKYKKEKLNDKAIAEKNAKLVNTLAEKLDTISLISSLTETENPAAPPWSQKLNASLSLTEDFNPYSNFTDLGNDIAEWLYRFSFKSEQSVSPTNFDCIHQLAVKRKVKLGVDFALSQAIPSTLEHRSTATDYLPVVRTICRTEQNRAKANTKRGNRFHNYLHGLNLTSASNNVLAAASTVFQDKHT